MSPESERFSELVRLRMARKGENYELAYDRCTSCHRAEYQAMSHVGRTKQQIDLANQRLARQQPPPSAPSGILQKRNGFAVYNMPDGARDMQLAREFSALLELNLP